MNPDDPDERLVAELRALYAHADPMPPYVLAAARAAIELRDLDAQLAELLRDSAVEDRELAGVRGLTATRLLSFSVGEDRFVEVDVTIDGDGRTLTGYVVPGSPGLLSVEHADGNLEAHLDEHGRFSVSRVPSGPVRLRLALPGARPVVTPWLPI